MIPPECDVPLEIGANLAAPEYETQADSLFEAFLIREDCPATIPTCSELHPFISIVFVLRPRDTAHLTELRQARGEDRIAQVENHLPANFRTNSYFSCHVILQDKKLRNEGFEPAYNTIQKKLVCKLFSDFDGFVEGDRKEFRDTVTTHCDTIQYPGARHSLSVVSNQNQL